MGMKVVFLIVEIWIIPVDNSQGIVELITNWSILVVLS